MSAADETSLLAPALAEGRRHTVYLVDVSRGRHPGSVSSIMKRHLRAATTGQAVDVPCGSCNACCRMPHLYAEVRDYERADFPEAVWQTADDMVPTWVPGWVLPKNPDGSCVHLIGGKCAIYERRPRACRTFDCRVALVTSTMPSPDLEWVEILQQWSAPTAPTIADRELGLALSMAANFEGAQGRHPTADEVRKIQDLARRMVREFDALPRPVQVQLAEEAARILHASAARPADPSTPNQKGTIE